MLQQNNVRIEGTFRETKSRRSVHGSCRRGAWRRTFGARLLSSRSTCGRFNFRAIFKEDRQNRLASCNHGANVRRDLATSRLDFTAFENAETGVKDATCEVIPLNSSEQSEDDNRVAEIKQCKRTDLKNGPAPVDNGDFVSPTVNWDRSGRSKTRFV